MLLENSPEKKPHERPNKENLQTQGHREADNGKLNPPEEPVGDQSIVYKGSAKCDHRNNLTYSETLDRQYSKDRLGIFGRKNPEGQFLRGFGDHEKDKAEHYDILQPHFSDR